LPRHCGRKKSDFFVQHAVASGDCDLGYEILCELGLWLRVHSAFHNPGEEVARFRFFLLLKPEYSSRLPELKKDWPAAFEQRRKPRSALQKKFRQRADNAPK